MKLCCLPTCGWVGGGGGVIGQAWTPSLLCVPVEPALFASCETVYGNGNVQHGSTNLCAADLLITNVKSLRSH